MKRSLLLALLVGPAACFGGGGGKFVESPYVEAVDLYDRGFKAEAADGLEKFLRSEPDHAPAHFNLAVIYHDWAVDALKEGDRATAETHAEKAVRHYGRVLEIDPKNDDAHINLAALYRELGDLPRAGDHLRLAEAINRARAALHIGWGAYHESSGDDTAAEAAYLRALETEPDHPDALYRVGYYREKRGQPAEALPYYQTLVQNHSDDVAGLVAVTRCLRELGRWEDAIPFYERALAVAPDRVDFVIHYAECLEQTGRLEPAVQEYLIAKRLLPTANIALIPTNPEPLPTVEEIEQRLQSLYQRLLER